MMKALVYHGPGQRAWETVLKVVLNAAVPLHQQLAEAAPALAGSERT